MIRVITYTNDLMTKAADLCAHSAIKYGAHDAKIIRREDLPEPLLNLHAFKQNHFCDYWAWKPWICFNEVNSMKDGDILIYSDAGIEFTGDINYVINSMYDDIFLFSNGWKHSEWCKMDVMNAVGIKPGEEKQVQASLMFFRVSTISKIFLSYWWNYSLIEGLITDEPSEATNVSTFAAARHDQSIIASLAIREKIPLHWYPVTTAYHIKAEYPGDNYPCIANHHRLRNHEWK